MRSYLSLIWTTVLPLVFCIAITQGSGHGHKLCKLYHGKEFNDNTICLLEANESLWDSFKSNLVTLNCSKCEIIYGKSPEEVEKEQSLGNRIFAGLLSFISGSDMRRNPGNATIRVPPNTRWYVSMRNKFKESSPRISVEMRPDPTCLACLIIGSLLFFSADRLSSSVKFYYTSGVGIGILASLLILVFILSRFVPKKPAAYTILLGGWSLGAMLLRYTWQNWHIVLREYYTYFVAYVAIAGFFSFAVCYWRGPVSNPRSQHIIQWSIQFLGLSLLYLSSQFQKVSVAIVVSVFLGNLLFIKQDFTFFYPLVSFFKTYVWKSKPEPPRLLTEEEYRLQGEIETRKALEELKEYCNSPKCSPWKTLSRIQSPSKFAKFMEGESHVSDHEMTLHEKELTDDDDALISEDEFETDNFNMHKGDNGTTLPKQFTFDPNISEDED